MLKDQLDQALSKLLKLILSFNYQAALRLPLSFLAKHINSWPRIGALVVFVLFFLYYPLGAYLTDSIDTDTSYETPVIRNQSATISTTTYIIKREINNKIWTPNLPFFFPASILDNMPAFQKGLISSFSNVIGSMSLKLDSKTDNSLQTGAELLNYPPTIWMFSPQNKLMPAPSSNSQYRRARKHLLKYNEALNSGETIFLKKPQDLRFILQRIQRNLQKSTGKLESHILETSSNWTDAKADEVFYYQQGKLYGYYLLLKALSADYKDIIVAQNIYQPWTELLKTLEDASALSPMIIRNAELDSSFAPNHLAIMSYYTKDAVLLLQNLSLNLEKLPQ